MLILVSGGAASGKSEYAESLIVRAGHEKRTYIATMEIFDAEGARRAARHRTMRAGKGFTTLECPRGLMEAALPAGGSALLECGAADVEPCISTVPPDLSDRNVSLFFTGTQ